MGLSTNKPFDPLDIPKDMLARLLALGEDPAQFRDIYDVRGREFFLSFLKIHVEGREEALNLLHHWAPKLRAYAGNCRAANRSPEFENLNPQERAKLSIFEDKITNAELIFPRDDNGVIICSLPLIGIPVAQRLWPGENRLAVILTPEELTRWHEIYQHPEDANRWWITYWWKIDDHSASLAEVNRKGGLAVPDGECPWLVESGVSWGSLAGGSTTELWSWDGKRVQNLGEISIRIS